MHCVALRCVALYCIALHRIASHCIAYYAAGSSSTRLVALAGLSRGPLAREYARYRYGERAATDGCVAQMDAVLPGAAAVYVEVTAHRLAVTR